MIRSVIASLLFFCIPIFVYGQNKDSINESTFPKSINEIIHLKPNISDEERVVITNLSSINIKEAPGAVIVITSEEIEKYGYVDLMDVIANVPGFNLSSDVQNGVSLSTRGMWASEAKILVMIDGLPINDMAYGSIILGGRFSLINIDRIEIIKGAGSSIYGGSAALGVIHIFTKSGKKHNGSKFLVTSGLSNNAMSRLGLGFNYGASLANGMDLSASGGIYNTNRSNNQFTLPDSTLVNLEDSSETNDVFVNFKVKFKGFEYGVNYDDYNFQATYEPIFSIIRSYNTILKYNFKKNKLSIVPYVNYKKQLPWNTQYGDVSIYNGQNLVSKRVVLGSNINYNFTNSFKIISGVEYYNDYYRPFSNNYTLNNGKNSDSFDAYAAFLETELNFKYLNLFVGARFDKYGYFKEKISPRISLTKDFGTWNYKFIYGQAFKIPALQNINLGSEDLEPEVVDDFQLELGTKWNKTEFKINAFYTQINGIILFNYDLSNFTESYKNIGFSAIQGAEFMFKKNFSQFSFAASYDFYTVVNSDVAEIVVDSSDLKLGMLGIPKSKINTYLTYMIDKKNSLLLKYQFQSSKYASEQISKSTGEYDLVRYPSTHNFNLSYQKKGMLDLFDLLIGVNNILNTNIYYLYPSQSGYFPLIGMGRELFIQLRFTLTN